MDKNSVIGFILIGVILVAYFKFTQPSEEERQAMDLRKQAYNDSIALVQQTVQQAQVGETTTHTTLEGNDSLETLRRKQNYGVFSEVVTGEEHFYVLENEKIKATLSSKGGRIVSVELKEFKRYDGSPVLLAQEDESKFSVVFTANNRIVRSSDLFFQKEQASNDELSLAIPMEGGSKLVFAYSLAPDSYEIKFSLEGDGMAQVFAPNSTAVDVLWALKMPQIEKGRTFEQQYSGLYYKYDKESGIEDLSKSGEDAETLTGRVKWVGFKDQFFSSVLVSDQVFQSGAVRSTVLEHSETHLKNMEAEMLVPFRPGVQESLSFSFYFLPNKLAQLKTYEGLSFDKLVPLGWGIFGWINKWLVIPIFNFLEKYFDNYGLIILFLTIIIKLLIFPFTYKSYLSTAKMRLLKPEIDKATAGIPEDQPMERQKATMSIYNKAGVSPMGGCIPMLFQMPILFAMFRFFPSAIELRQKAFLWADDLSSYDAYFTWSQDIPLISSLLGNHLSLFCILMAVVNLIYTHINSQMTASTASMPMMKYMMYIMPIVFVFVLNNYASGLSYYYFLSTLITIIQTFAMRYMVNDEKLWAKLEANKKKPKKKKSGFQARLEEVQRRQQAEAKKRAQSRKGKR